MRGVGISIYLAKSTFEQDKAYLELASKYGFSRVFMSLLEIEDDAEIVMDKFGKIIQYAKDLGIRTVLDINPGLFSQLNVSYDHLGFFKKLGADTIRLDLGFTGREEARMTENSEGLKIEINMSSGTCYIDNIMSFHPNKDYLTASHNFYPQKYSGLSQKHFEKTTKKFNDYGIHTAAFITADDGNLGPWPIQDGLCTLEAHRYLSVRTQASHYRLMGVIDDLFIGNAYATEKELRDLSEIYLSEVPILEVEFFSNNKIEQEILLGNIHHYRGDCSDYMIRSSQTRGTYAKENLLAHDTQPIKRGDILICNNEFGQYKGEVQIALREMTNEGNRNVVGRIKPEALFLLDFLKPNTDFMFKVFTDI